MKILVVDDDSDFLVIIQTILEPYGACQTSHNGNDAFTKFCEALRHDEPYDVICIDLSMPSLNGIEAIKQMREIERKTDVPEESRTRLVVVTVHDSGQIIENAIRAGADAYVNKARVKIQLPRTLKELGLIE